MTELDASTPIIRHPDLVAAEMDGDLVMMSIEKGEYYGVSGVGPRIWELLEAPVTVEQMTTTLCEEFEVDAVSCLRDTLNFVRELRSMGLVREA